MVTPALVLALLPTILAAPQDPGPADDLGGGGGGSGSSGGSTTTTTTVPAPSHDPTGSPNTTTPSSLLHQLRNAPSQADRIGLLMANGGGSDAFKFDFSSPPAHSTLTPGLGTFVSTAGSTFPATWGQGLSAAQASLEPCSAAMPHVWSRAGQLLLLQDGLLNLQFYTDTGSPAVNTSLVPDQMVYIPQGALRFFWNPSCSRPRPILCFSTATTRV